MNQSVLYQWIEEIAMQLPSLNSWQADNLGLFSYGVVQSESSQQMAIARHIVCGEQVASAERRLRRFMANEALDLEAFFSDWTAWMMRCCEGSEVKLLVDETKLDHDLGVMVVGMAYESRCIPLAWRCYQTKAYPEEGQVKLISHLLRLVKAGMPDTMRVTVLADRGIGTSPDLCREVEQLGWYYLFRITKQSKIITDQGEYTIYDQVNEGEQWAASGKVFKKRGRLDAHARAVWENGYEQPWALVTNDEQITGYEYGTRNWQEQGFRDLKSGGWHWASSRIRCPQRMMKLLMILVVAYAWIVGLGSYAVHAGSARPLTRRPDGTKRRQWSLFKEGLQWFYNYVIRYTVCLKPCFIPDKRLL